MRWEAHLAQGFFGFEVRAGSASPRWSARDIDFDEVQREVGDVLDAWVGSMKWPNVPPFSGGVLDAWPARLADGLAFAREEWALVRAYVLNELRPKEVHGG